MKRFSQRGHGSLFFNALEKFSKEFISLPDVKRRKGWFIENLTPRKLVNLLVAGMQFGLKQEVMRAWPVVVKVDISPLCNLRCTICVHAGSNGSSGEHENSQSFTASQKMSLDQFKRIVEEISGKSIAVSLYYLGDPLIHPQLDDMCGIARAGSLNSHISTNLSFSLSDERIRSIVMSGLTHLTVCIDGMTQENYERTRVGGRIEVVLGNLERLIRCRRDLGRTYPKVEAQFIKFQHNVNEVEEAFSYCQAIGVDQFTEFWGDLGNCTDLNPGKYKAGKPKENRRLPQCLWPHFALQIKYNGDVIPCCNYRLGLQYGGSGDQRIVGNVFKTSLWDVWNSAEYRALRRFVSNPEQIKNEGDLAKTFCDGCPTIFYTDQDKLYRRGDVHRWEDLYEIDNRKRVTRKQAV